MNKEIQYVVRFNGRTLTAGSYEETKSYRTLGRKYSVRPSDVDASTAKDALANVSMLSGMCQDERDAMRNR